MPTTQFDYSNLPAGISTSLQVRAARINQSKRTMVREGLAIGAELSAARDELAGVGRDGLFAPWLKSMEFSKSYAYVLIGLYEKYPEGSVQFQDTSLSLSSMISISSAPDDIRPQVEAAVQAELAQHKRVTAAKIEEMKREFSSKEHALKDDMEKSRQLLRASTANERLLMNERDAVRDKLNAVTRELDAQAQTYSEAIARAKEDAERSVKEVEV